MPSANPEPRRAASARPFWRPLIAWGAFFAILLAGLVLAGVYGRGVPVLFADLFR